MNSIDQFEDRASSRRGQHEGEPSGKLCDRLSRTRDASQRQLPTDQDYAVSTREYQIDPSSPKPAPAAARPVLERGQKQRQRQKQPHRCAEVDRSLHISSRRIKIMRFRPANIRLINRRSKLPRLLLALSSNNYKSKDNNKNHPSDVQVLTGSLHIRETLHKS